MQRGRAAAVGAQIKLACVAVEGSSQAVQLVQRGSAALLSVACRPVSGEPVRLRAMQDCGYGAAYERYY